MLEVLSTAAISAGVTAAFSAVVKLVKPKDPNDAVATGIVGNWSDRILLTGLTTAYTAWGCFRANCRALSPRENHILYRGFLAAHWRAVAQAAVACVRSRGLQITSAADALPFPRAVQDLIIQARRPAGLPPEDVAELNHLRALVTDCHRRAQAAASEPEPKLEAEWSAAIDPLYDNLTAMMAQPHQRPTMAPTQPAWAAVAAAYPEAATSLGFQPFFEAYWFDCFLVEFQFFAQQPGVAPLLTGKLFTEIRQQPNAPALDPQAILHELAGMEQRIVDAVAASERNLTAHLEEIKAALAGRKQAAAPKEPAINLPNLRAQVLGREAEAQALREALRQKGPGLLTLVAPAGFGKTALLTRALDLAMPERGEPEEAGLNGIAILDARAGAAGLTAMAGVIGRITGLHEAAAAFAAPPPDAPPDSRVRYFFDFLRRAGRCWLVVDNAEESGHGEADPELAAVWREWSDHQHEVRLLVISRFPLEALSGRPGRLDGVERALAAGLSPAAAVELLRLRLAGSRFAQADEVVLAAAADRLHRIPLALIQFAGYLISREGSVKLDQKFIERNELLRLFDARDLDRSIGRLVNDQVSRLGKLSQELLRVMTWFGEPLPEAGVPAVLGSGDNGPILTYLQRAGLIDRREGTPAEGVSYVLHPLVAQLMGTPEPPKPELFESWDRAASAEHSAGRPGPELSLTAATVRIARKGAETGKQDWTERLAGSLLNYGYALRQLGQLNESLKVQQESRRLLRRMVDLGRLDFASHYATALDEEASTLMSLNRVDEANHANEQATSFLRSLIQNQSRLDLTGVLARNVMSTGRLLFQSGRLEEALSRQNEALAAWRRLSAGNPRDFRVADQLAGTLGLLGNTLFELGRTEDAIQSQSEAIEVYRRLLTQGQPVVNSLAITVANLGAVLNNLKRHRDALELYKSAVETLRAETTRKGRRELEIYLAACLENEGVTHYNLKDLTAAARVTEEARQIYQGLLQSDRRTTAALFLARANFRLCRIRWSQRRFDEARHLNKEAVQMQALHGSTLADSPEATDVALIPHMAIVYDLPNALQLPLWVFGALWARIDKTPLASVVNWLVARLIRQAGPLVGIRKLPNRWVREPGASPKPADSDMMRKS